MTEIKSNQLFYYSITEDCSNFVSINIELNGQIDNECMKRAIGAVSKQFPYLQVRLVPRENSLILEPNDRPVKLYHDDGCHPFVLSENEDYLYRFSVVGHKFSLSFTHGLMDAVSAFTYMKTVLQVYYRELEGKAVISENTIRVSSAEEMEDPFERIPADTVPQRTEEKTIYKFPEPQMAGYQIYRFAVPEAAFVQLTKKNRGSVNSMITWLLGKAIRNVHTEALQEQLTIAVAINAKPLLGVAKAVMPCLHTVTNIFDEQLDACDIAEANEVIRGNIAEQCDKKVLVPRLAGITWLDRYLEQLPNLEAKKQMCRKVIGMQRSTANISYTGKFEWGEVETHIRSCYTYADAASMLAEINCVNGRICFAFTQKFRSDCYVRAFCELLEKYNIECTEIEACELYI